MCRHLVFVSKWIRTYAEVLRTRVRVDVVVWYINMEHMDYNKVALMKENGGAKTSCSIASVNLKIQLNSIRDAIVLQRDVILKRPFALPSQHNLSRLSSNARRNHELELPDRVRRQAWNG